MDLRGMSSIGDSGTSSQSHKRGASADAILEMWEEESRRSQNVAAADDASSPQRDSEHEDSEVDQNLSASCSSLPRTVTSDEVQDATDAGPGSAPADDVATRPDAKDTKRSIDLRGLGLNVVNLVDVIFQFGSRGWIKRQVLGVARQVLQICLGNTIDTFIAARLGELCTGETVAKGVRYLQNEILWPDKIWFENHPEKMTSDQWSEYTRFAASCVHLLLVDSAPPSLVNLIGKSHYRRCMNDVFYVVQSKVFMRQLGCNVLDLMTKTWFPELTAMLDRRLTSS